MSAENYQCINKLVKYIYGAIKTTKRCLQNIIKMLYPYYDLCAMCIYFVLLVAFVVKLCYHFIQTVLYIW